MKKVLVIGGAGAMGQVIVRDLLDADPALAVIIADFDESKAAKMAQSLSQLRGEDKKSSPPHQRHIY